MKLKSELKSMLRIFGIVQILLGAASVLFLIASCSPKLEKLSSADPGLFEKIENGSLTGFARPIGDSAAPPELYVKHKEIVAKPQNRASETGSLFNSDDDRNYLFTAAPVRPGSILVLKMASNRSASPGAGAPSGASTGGAVAKGAPSTKGASASAVEDELVKAMPDLAPADKSAAFMSQINAEVTHVDSNGDVHVMYRRRSVSGDQAHEIRFNARIPNAKVNSGEQLTTEDLSAVNWVESVDGQITERKSGGWEDEYSMRISGFDEVRSKSALALEDKRKQLLDVRNRMDARLKSFAEERQRMATLREDLVTKDKEKETKIADLQGTVDQQKEEIDRLKPSENTEAKLGDSKDGKNGKK